MVALFHVCKSDVNEQWILGEFEKVMFNQFMLTLSISKIVFTLSKLLNYSPRLSVLMYINIDKPAHHFLFLDFLETVYLIKY